MPRAFLITNRRYISRNHKVLSGQAKDCQYESISKTIPRHTDIPDIQQLTPPGSPVYVPVIHHTSPSKQHHSNHDNQSKVSSEDVDSDFSYTSSPGHETRPDLSPKMDFRYDCSSHISLLFDFINQSPRKIACKEFFDHESDAVRALNFDEPSYSQPKNIIKTLTPLENLVNKPFHDPLSSDDITDEHVCLECGKRYSTSSNLARHRQTHRSVSDKKARKCPHCEKVYVSMPAYSMHVRTHSQGCECMYCGKRFSRPWLLQGHIRTHTGEKPFSCPKCGKCFADKSNLRAHIQTHSVDKPYTCGRCGKAFALKSYLYKHEESSCMRGQRNKDKVTMEDVTSDGQVSTPSSPRNFEKSTDIAW